MPNDSDIEKFVPTGSIDLSSGESIDLPKLTWGREIKIYKELSKLILEVPELKEMDLENFKTQYFIKMLPNILGKAPDSLTVIVGYITGQEKAFIEKNFDTDDIIKVMTPFFSRLINQFTKALGGTEDVKEGTTE